jgi:aryl-phospho-beta-D-glucosidase BglC (GH1 family)
VTIAVRNLILQLFAVGLAGVLNAQTLSNIGTAAPSPGTNDIRQLSTHGDQTWPDGLNYFTDNNPPAGQTFTTGTSAMNLVSVAIKTAGLNSGNGYGTPSSTPTYYLRIYSMSGSTATLLTTFRAPNPGFTDGDWLQWSGLNVPLAANKTYAFSFGIQPTGGGWAALAVATNAYAGGEIAFIPIIGGAITTGSSHRFAAVFDLGLRATNSPAATPLPNPTYGWNLGNTLEPPCGAGCWGPLPTEALINAAASAGFNAIRIPCAWDSNADQTNYQINATYMAQVQQVVDWSIAAGMTVVINDHWDDGWLEDNIGTTVDPTINAKMNSYWTQIATAFSGYGNSLLFAAANEPNVSSPAEMATLMVYYQTFVNAVRGAGGNNTNRWLVLQGGGDVTWLNTLPTDPTPNRLMVEYHCYTPFQFTQLTSDASWGIMYYFWGPAYYYSGDPTRNTTPPAEGAIDSGFQQLTDQYVRAGIPVMVGEFEATWRGNITGTESNYSNASRLYWDKYVAESARAHGLSPFYWSTPGGPFDWTTGAVDDPQGVTALTGGTAPPPPNGAPYAASGLTATAGNGQVTLSWIAGSGAAGYNLYRAAESGCESTTPVVTGITGTSYTDTGLNSGTTYYYQVVATNSSGSSGFSPEAYATTPGVNPDPAIFNFETDTQGWAAGGSPIAGVATSTAQHFAGRQSLAVNFDGTAAGTSSVSVGNVAAPPGTTITFHVWIPGGSQITSLQPYLQDYNWNWASSWYGNLTANAWNTLTLTVPSTSVTPLQQLGIQFATSAAWSGTCFIDSVAWNTPPTLVPIANQTVNVGQTVAFTAIATDSDQQPQTLTQAFELLNGATNAMLNTNSGAFSFRPLVTQANSTNNFTLEVLNNNTSPLSATQSFSIIVNPLSAPGISNISISGGKFSFNVSGQTGPDYAIETSANLTQWSSVYLTNSPALPFVWTDTNSSAPLRFYRVKLGPPLP